MNPALSPLRYPGGKSSLYLLLSNILDENGLRKCPYVEPYAGGCGLALSLLFKGDVSEIHINDLDVPVWSFWHCVLERTEELIAKIKKTPITIEEWHIQRAIHKQNDPSDVLALGFATFFLNRTNRSGIIKGAGPIGGLNQAGNYKLDCRFNQDQLIERIIKISQYKDRIHLTNKDALALIISAKNDLPSNSFFCIDPPYFHRGSVLYTSAYSYQDHIALSQAILKLNFPWVLTYDYTPEIKDLYHQCRQFCFDIHYSLQTKKIGQELLIAVDTLQIKLSLAA